MFCLRSGALGAAKLSISVGAVILLTRSPGPRLMNHALSAGLMIPVESLAAWLARHGQWDAAAADLGVHRHTLRYRMQRVEELLGRSLDDADLRAELWLALRVSR